MKQKSFFSKTFSLILLLLLTFCVAQDPAGSWLAFTKSAGNGKLVTYVNSTWTVPSPPAENGGQIAIWYGIEPSPALNLIQPILKWLGGWYIFNEYFQWDNEHDFQSRRIQVQPGEQIFAEVILKKQQKAYEMHIVRLKTGENVNTTIPIEQGKTYTDTYFVIEHQPFSCRQYPANGEVTFTNINIKLEDQLVTPTWEAKKWQDACDCTPVVLSPSSVKFTWKP